MRQPFVRAVVAVLVGALCAHVAGAQRVVPIVGADAVKLDFQGTAAIDDAGSAVFAASSTDPFGTNPDHAPQILRWTLPSGAPTQVLHLDRGAYGAVSVTDDGSRLAFVSASEVVGQNHDESLELFLVDADGSDPVQLTSHALPSAGAVWEAKISGSGTRVVFLADGDPSGTNPDRSQELFVIDSDGTDLVQLTSGTSIFAGFDISDDGSRIVFARASGNSSQIFRILADGTGLTPLTAAGQHARRPVLSGAGDDIAFEVSGTGTVHAVKWSGVNLQTLSPGAAPTISDNGKFVYFHHQGSVRRKQVGSAEAPVVVGVGLEPIVSGGDVRIAFRRSGSVGLDLWAMDREGGQSQALATNQTGRQPLYRPAIAHDGSFAIFSGFSECRRVDVEAATHQTISTTACGQPSLTVDGASTYFLSQIDTGHNPCGRPRVFRMPTGGGSVEQVSWPDQCDADDFWPVVAAGGGMLVTQALIDFGAFAGVAGVPLGGAPPIELVDTSMHALPRVSDDGVWTVIQSNWNGDGGNPGNQSQILRVRTDGSQIVRLTADASHPSYGPDIDGEGLRVAWSSHADPLGTNPDHSRELFEYDTSTGTLRQLTAASRGVSLEPRYSRDGEWIVFQSSAPLFGEAPPGGSELYRVEVASGSIERFHGLRDPAVGLRSTGTVDRPDHAVDLDGDRVVLSGAVDLLGDNPDGSDGLWILDATAPGRVFPSVTTPTTLRWDVDPRYVRYDVIRGDVASLAGAGASVDLGPVVCLEDDSPDADTRGFEDPLAPASGQVFFYVWRGTQGLADGPGSWGRSASGQERVAGAGACAP